MFNTTPKGKVTGKDIVSLFTKDEGVNKQTPKNRKQFTSSPFLISWVDELMKGSRMELIKKKELHLHRLTDKTFYSVKQE